MGSENLSLREANHLPCACWKSLEREKGRKRERKNTSFLGSFDPVIGKGQKGSPLTGGMPGGLSGRLFGEDRTGDGWSYPSLSCPGFLTFVLEVKDLWTTV